MKKSVVVRFEDYQASTHKLNRLRGDVLAASFVDLITQADLEANPRVAKRGPVTSEIEDCLVESPELFHYKSKGLLVACREVELLERKRVRLEFEDSELEGILDGGHNTLAIARHVIKVALGDDADSALSKLKTWTDLPAIWAEAYEKIQLIREQLDFLIPMEVIYPLDGPAGAEEFNNAILDINRARNNNAQLTESTKAHKSGFYEEIKANLDGDLASDVEWKANDGGRIKSRDLVALSLIPLSVLPESAFQGDEPAPNSKIVSSPTMIFSSKGNCVTLYNDIVRHPGVSAPIQGKGEIIEVVHEGVKSAFAMMKDMPKLYDLIYEMVPIAANASGAKFGKIDSVKMYDPSKAKNGQQKYLKTRPKTKYYRKDVDYDYGEGFVVPLVYALRELMEYRDGRVSWKVDPYRFVKDHLSRIMESYYGMIVGQSYDPAKVGKQQSSYKAAQDFFRVQVMLHTT
jgi:hypothetical protein